MPWTKAEAKAMRRKYGLGEFAKTKRSRKVRRTKKPVRKASKARRRPSKRRSSNRLPLFFTP